MLTEERNRTDTKHSRRLRLCKNKQCTNSVCSLQCISFASDTVAFNRPEKQFRLSYRLSEYLILIRSAVFGTTFKLVTLVGLPYFLEH